MERKDHDKILKNLYVLQKNIPWEILLTGQTLLR